MLQGLLQSSGAQDLNNNDMMLVQAWPNGWEVGGLRRSSLASTEQGFASPDNGVGYRRNGNGRMRCGGHHIGDLHATSQNGPTGMWNQHHVGVRGGNTLWGIGIT